ncbi:MAG: pyridoxal-phosphate dependent enzyme [Lachnospiraceae bacterium]
MERRGYFHQKFGGQYMPEALMNALSEMEGEHQFVAQDQCFTKELDYFCNEYGGRKTPLYKARLLSKKYGPDIYFKREDLLYCGGGSFQAIAGQMIIGKRTGKNKVLIPVCNPQHGCIAAGLAAAMGMACEVVMPEITARSHHEEILEMQLVNALITIIPGDFEEVCRTARARWITQAPEVVYIQTRAAGPHPYPLMVREYQKVIGEEMKEQMLEACGKLPELIVAAVGDDAAAIGAFTVFENESGVKLIAAEREDHAVLSHGEEGISEGMRSLFLQNDQGDCLPGKVFMDMPCQAGAEPELAAMAAEKRVFPSIVTREEAILAALEVAALEGFLPGENSSYAVAEALKASRDYALDENIVVVLSGKAERSWIETCMRKKVER